MRRSGCGCGGRCGRKRGGVKEWECWGRRDRSNSPVIVKEKLNELFMLFVFLCCGGVKRKLGSIANLNYVEGTVAKGTVAKVLIYFILFPHLQ